MVEREATEARIRELEDALRQRDEAAGNICRKLADWMQALWDAKTEYDALPEDKRGWHSPPPLYDGPNPIAVLKSNLLYRLIYLGEDLRTEKCPEHQGRWSGVAWPGEECEHGCCDSGGNITGWLA